MISTMLMLVFCIVTKVVPDFPNLPLMYLIRLDKVRSSFYHCILRTCVAAGPLPASLRVSEILVQYLMLRDSEWFCVVFLPAYANRSPVIIYTSSTSDATCGNFHSSWEILRPL